VAAGYGLAARVVGADAAVAAGLARDGTLAEESALRLFSLAAALRATGTLTLSAQGGATYALSFRRGTVAHVGSTDPEDDLGRVLVRRGAIDEQQRRRGAAASARGGGDLATALVTERLVNPAEIATLLQEHGVTLVQRALAAAAGSWSWKPDAAPPPSSFPLGASLAMLCAVVRALDAAALLSRLGGREGRTATRVGGRIRLEELRLAPQEARAAALFDGVRSPAEIAAANPTDALAVLRVALLLAEVDLLAFGAPRGGAPPAPVAPSPKPAVAGTAARPAASARPTARSPAPPRPPSPAPPPAASPPPRAASPTVLDRAALQALVQRLAKADHFEVLGVDRGAAAQRRKLAYFELAKTYHPDAVPSDADPEIRKLCADVFARVSEAWSVLGDDASRDAYLSALKSGGTADVDVMRVLQAESAFHAGTLLVKARRYAEAIARIDEAIALNPDEAEFAMWRAWCEFLLASDKRRHLPAAVAAIEAALRRNPRCAQGYLFLGQMGKLAGDLALAERQLRRGLAVAPDHPELQRELKYLGR
jgi:curved DNA-binding protein CbpA